MVVVRHHQVGMNAKNLNIFTQLPMGDADSPLLSLKSKSRVPTLMPVSSLSQWTLRLVYLVVLTSWFSAFRFKIHLGQTSTRLESTFDRLEIQREQTLKLIQNAKDNKNSLLREIRKQQRIARLFQHEARISKEIYNQKQTNHDSDFSRLVERRQKGVATDWMQQRQWALENKIVGLQSNLQEQSRKIILEKYGPGPHFIEVDVLTGPNARVPGRFVVELASINYMPCSVLSFMDMVEQKLWDNTVFYHHSSQHHVVAAAPVTFGTFDSKSHHFAALGHKGITYPEYSARFSHSKYTLGFSDTGPNFYINTIDNSKHHGPGGQGHHELPGDADPCFGKVVSGHEVIEKMMPIHNTSLDPKAWADFDLTRIVRIRVRS